jgi:metal-responsive CopG/Arc/MetJ family transcriptional regulator
MKTAISLPDTLYERAEETATYLGIPRSKLYALALEEFVINHNANIITEKINEIYDQIDQKDFEPYLDATLEAQRNLLKNDTW